MATYAIGDVQGCLRELEALLREFDFSPGDVLWFVGDLVNRGPDSSGVLRLVRGFADRAICVLGNHDLHLLACALGTRRRRKPGDTLDDVLTAPDRDDLLAWLRTLPLLHHNPLLHFTLVHAGLPPQWDLEAAQVAADEVQRWLRGDDYISLLESMYGSQPARWSDAHDRLARCRFTINALTRMRFCTSDGALELDIKDSPGVPLAPHLHAWFDAPGRVNTDLDIVFGHWSTLRLPAGEAVQKRVWNLDTGCVWGGRLTAMRLEDRAWFSVASQTRAAIQ